MKTDAQLIKEARTNADAFAELYERHVRSVHGWFRAHVEPGAAMDLTAETFAQAACGLRRFRDEAGGSAGPWLFGIAKNLHRRYLERRRVETVGRRRLGMPLVSYTSEFDETDERVSAETLTPDLHAAVNGLPKGQREALELRVVGELSYREVAATLGTSELAARLRVMRALGSLAEKLKGATQ